MSARDIDLVVVQRRLELIRELLGDLTAAGSITAERLRGDRMLRHGVERILTQMVDLATAVNSHLVVGLVGRAPEDYRSSFFAAAAAGVLSSDLAQRLGAAVGLRNVLIHEYVDVDFDVVVESAGTAVGEFEEYCRQLGRWLDRSVRGEAR